jgi:hypothetical protein
LGDWITFTANDYTWPSDSQQTLTFHDPLVTDWQPLDPTLAQQTFTITNHGFADHDAVGSPSPQATLTLTINDPNRAFGFVTDNGTSPPTTAFTITTSVPPAGGTSPVTVEYLRPYSTGATGNFSDSASITWSIGDDTTSPPYTSCMCGPFSHAGCGPLGPLLVGSTYKAVISAPPSLEFGSVYCGGTATDYTGLTTISPGDAGATNVMAFAIGNTGTTNFTITSFTLTPGMPPSGHVSYALYDDTFSLIIPGMDDGDQPPLPGLTDLSYIVAPSSYRTFYLQPEQIPAVVAAADLANNKFGAFLAYTTDVDGDLAPTPIPIHMHAQGVIIDDTNPSDPNSSLIPSTWNFDDTHYNLSMSIYNHGNAPAAAMLSTTNSNGGLEFALTPYPTTLIARTAADPIVAQFTPMGCGTGEIVASLPGQLQIRPSGGDVPAGLTGFCQTDGVVADTHHSGSPLSMWVKGITLNASSNTLPACADASH